MTSNHFNLIGWVGYENRPTCLVIHCSGFTRYLMTLCAIFSPGQMMNAILINLLCNSI